MYIQKDRIDTYLQTYRKAYGSGRWDQHAVNELRRLDAVAVRRGDSSECVYVCMHETKKSRKRMYVRNTTPHSLGGRLMSELIYDYIYYL